VRWARSGHVEQPRREIEVAARSLKLATKLVDEGADVNAVGTEGEDQESTPLWWAARALVVYLQIPGALDLATLLVEKGANVSAVGSPAGAGGGQTTSPLWWAAVAVHGGTVEGAAELATLLVAKGADVNAVGADTGGYECTPLWWAAWAVCEDKAGGLELATLLVEHGADVNAVGKVNREDDDCKSSALWRAAQTVWEREEGGLQLATLLVQHGADVIALGEDEDGNVGRGCHSVSRAKAWCLLIHADAAFSLPLFPSLSLRGFHSFTF
jgi:hypothetical protein